MSNFNLLSIMAAFQAADTTATYNAAKRRAVALSTIQQLALIDSMIDAHHRIVRGRSKKAVHS